MPRMLRGIMVLVLLAVPSMGSAYVGVSPPLATYTVQPCRVLDTRVSIGPLSPLQALNVFVRGSNLQAADGALHADCDIPMAAEAVIINIEVVSPTTGGCIVANASGSFPYPRGTPYCRMNFRAIENTSNEIVIRLCNAGADGYPQVACTYDGMGRYRDFDLWAVAPPGSLVHVVGDVVGYLARIE